MKLKFHPKEVHLKAEEITKFKALFIVSKDDFISEDFKKAYSISRKVMNDSENDEFFIAFSFTPSSDNLSEHCLISDGFFMKYDPKHRPAYTGANHVDGSNRCSDYFGSFFNNWLFYLSNYKIFIMTNTNLYTICFLVALVSIFFFLNPFLWAQGLAIGLGVFAAAISVVAFIKAQK